MGASSGVGRDAALRFARKGARVVVSARDTEGLASLVAEIREQGGEAMSVPADVTDFARVQEVAHTAVRHYGRLDTWVHTASVIMYASFRETTPEEFRQVVDINLLGAANGIAAALPILDAQGRGALIIVSSVEGRQAFPLQSAYAASKHGLEGLLDTLRMELRDTPGISLTNVIPSSINTPIFEKSRTRLGTVPRAVPPFYAPGVVSGAILYAAEHPVPEIWAGESGRALLAIKQVAPALVDDALARMAPRLQRTGKPRPEDAPDNLFHPVPGYATVHGSHRALPVSPLTWLQTHPLARAALGWALLAVASWQSHRLAERATPGRLPSGDVVDNGAGQNEPRCRPYRPLDGQARAPRRQLAKRALLDRALLSHAPEMLRRRLRPRRPTLWQRLGLARR
jgi:NAD(P)-dependent dehydrogenase (short-subunit alcohol dehydrogenase family)